MATVWEILIHACGVEVPDRRPRHDIQPQGTKNDKVHGCVGLLHESVLLCTGANAVGDCDWADDALHEKLSGKGENDDVEGHEGKVFGSFIIIGRSIRGVDGVGRYERMVLWEGIGKEDGAVERVGRCWINDVDGDEDNNEDERVHPCVPKGEIFPSADGGADFSSFGAAGDFCLGGSLWNC